MSTIKTNTKRLVWVNCNKSRTNDPYWQIIWLFMYVWSFRSPWNSLCHNCKCGKTGEFSRLYLYEFLVAIIVYKLHIFSGSGHHRPLLGHYTSADISRQSHSQKCTHYHCFQLDIRWDVSFIKGQTRSQMNLIIQKYFCHRSPQGLKWKEIDTCCPSITMIMCTPHLTCEPPLETNKTRWTILKLRCLPYTTKSQSPK